MAVPGSPVDRHRKDASTGAVIGISYPHHERHGGTTFEVSYIAETLADDATIEFVITVNTPKEAHLTFSGACGGNATMYLYESPTVVATGTAMDVRNVNRVVGDGGNQVTVVRDPASIGGDGNDLKCFILPGGTGGNAGGGQASTRQEHILKPGLIYLLRITNISGATKPTSLGAEFYEHEPRG